MHTSSPDKLKFLKKYKKCYNLTNFNNLLSINIKYGFI